MITWRQLLLGAVLSGGACTSAFAQNYDDAIRTLMTEAVRLKGANNCNGFRSAHTLVSAAVELATQQITLKSKADSLRLWKNGVEAKVAKSCPSSYAAPGNGGGGRSSVWMNVPSSVVVGGGGKCAGCGKVPPDVLNYYLLDDEARSMVLRVAKPEFAAQIKQSSASFSAEIMEIESLRELGLDTKQAMLIQEGRSFQFTPKFELQNFPFKDPLK